MKPWRSFLVTLLALLGALAPVAEAASTQAVLGQGAAGQPAAVSVPTLPSLNSSSLPSLVDASDEGGRLGTAVEIAILLTVLSLLPAILITITSFTRIVIVLSFVRRALSVNDLPPNPVIVGLALFLTFFVMGPVGARVYDAAYVPYDAGELTAAEAAEVAWDELGEFLVKNTRESELVLFADMAEYTPTVADEELPMRVVVPAFVLSELKTAFQMGFLLFLPFLVIDLVVSSVLLSMGMFMLPPVMISTPIKILLFVLVDGWHLICESMVTSFVTG
ncbi:MAG: flagellar type III secretion system pore protein FliP [Planctomycetota bacterium]|jgi:flagellar biosynthetic protein FliP|nr:flagellar biosynthetic protein FliP [Planctomycetota bacterium]MDP6368763.1 flagellar type III secretion system pore protein FliP [Planctomycetota bacterium]MDP6839454.1 flagellar type III secretion system pore protein FliP [Planctomycetota bacterium]